VGYLHGCSVIQGKKGLHDVYGSNGDNGASECGVLSS